MAKKTANFRDETRVTTLGRDPDANFGVVNPPVYHASTILYPTYESLKAYDYPATPYGRMGTPSTLALEAAFSELEGAHSCKLCPSGQAAIAIALLSVLAPGDHLLIVDSVYEPVRMFANSTLKRLGVDIAYYDPTIGAGIEDLMTDKTTVVFAESPGSLTFEVMDIPAIAEVAHRRGALVLFDNTWGTPLHFRAFDHGVDVSIHAMTKYVGGHADCMMGAINYTKEVAPRIEKTYRSMGICVGPDDAYLTQRGLRTMSVRLKQHEAAGLEVSKWLQRRDEIARVLNPALPDDPGHALWKRDFAGANGLFGIEFKEGTEAQLAAFCNALELFGMGFSWGGYESLIVPADLSTSRTATKDLPRGPLFRIHVGLEAPEDLISDLERGFAAYHKAGGS